MIITEIQISIQYRDHLVGQLTTPTHTNQSKNLNNFWWATMVWSSNQCCTCTSVPAGRAQGITSDCTLHRRVHKSTLHRRVQESGSVWCPDILHGAHHSVVAHRVIRLSHTIIIFRVVGHCFLPSFVVGKWNFLVDIFVVVDAIGLESKTTKTGFF